MQRQGEIGKVSLYFPREMARNNLLAQKYKLCLLLFLPVVAMHRLQVQVLQLPSVTFSFSFPRIPTVARRSGGADLAADLLPPCVPLQLFVMPVFYAFLELIISCGVALRLWDRFA
jgi:hypothetical protein